MSKLFFILCLWFVTMQSAQSQNILRGTIHDESKTGISSTTIRILTEDSVFVNGGITNDNGIFLIKNIKEGKYILVASNIGYVSQYINFTMPKNDFTLSLITLRTENILLDAVEITGSTVIHKKDHLLIIPDKQQLKHAFSGYDLLYNLMIPGLNVNRKNGTVTTQMGEATIYINGVRADIHEVQNLRPKDIEKVEYYNLPTGKYVGDAASINYIIKKYKTGGYITLGGEQYIGYLNGNYDLGSKVSHNNTNYTFFGGYNIKEYDGMKKEKNDNIFFPNHTVSRNSTNNDADFSANQQYAQLKISNDTKKRNLSGQLSFIRNETPHNDRSETLNYISYNEQNIQSTEKVNNESIKPSIRLNGIFHPTEKQQVEMLINGSYTQNIYKRSYTEGEQRSFTNANEDLYSFDVRSYYTNQLTSQNTLDISLMHFHNITSSLYSGDYNSWQHLRMGETLFMFAYIHEFGKNLTLALIPGCSLLNYKLHKNDLQRFWTFRTNTWIRYHFNSRHWAGVGFSTGNDQPELSYLNSMDQTIDFYQVKRGNPNLTNTKLYDWFIAYEGQIKPFNIQFDLWYTRYSHNICMNYFLENNKLISSYSSDGSFNKIKANISISYRISKNLRANLGLKYRYMNVPKKSNLSQDNFTASLDVNYFLKSFAINAYAKTQEKSLDNSTLAFMKTPASYGLSIRYNNKQWMAEIGMENLFTNHAHYQEYADYEVYKYNQILTSRIYQQTGYIKLAYTFDFGKKTSQESNNVDKSIKSAILKTK